MSDTDTLSIEVSQLEQGVVITLVGNASMEHCDRLNASLLEACNSQPDRLIIDLSQLRFICSLGLGAIVVAYLRVQKTSGRIALVKPTPPIRAMLDTTKLGTLLPIYDSVEQAVSDE